MGLMATTEQMIINRTGGKEIPAGKRWGLSLEHSEGPNSWSQAAVIDGKYCSAVCNKNFFSM
jgi:hypothetical protein